MKIYPVILSGGAGTRLWPLSRAVLPKQLLPLVGERTMLQDTALRLAGRPQLMAPLDVCGNEHRFLVAEQMREIELVPLSVAGGRTRTLDLDLYREVAAVFFG